MRNPLLLQAYPLLAPVAYFPHVTMGQDYRTRYSVVTRFI